MEKKGFTLIELLAVIAILAIIATISFTSITGQNQAIKDKMLEKKYDLIQEAAVLWGEDFRNELIASSKKYNNNKCVSKTVKDFVPDYLDKDKDVNCGSGCIVDPSGKSSYLDNNTVIVYYKNKRVYAKVAGTSDRCS